MTTKLEQTIEILLKNPANFITNRGVETTMKNGRNEILLSVKGLTPTSAQTEAPAEENAPAQSDSVDVTEETIDESTDTTEAPAIKTKKKYNTKSGSK
jgi:hypothetical protein